MAFISYKLLDKKTDPNSFFLEANGKEDHERKLDFTNSYWILNPFFILKNGVREYKRYITGCAIYDPVEQDKQKIAFNNQTGGIKFSKGADIVLEESLGKVLIDFLDMHPNNESSKNHIPGFHEAIFFRWNPKDDIEKEIKSVDAEDEAMDILRQLKKNPEKMRSVALVFAETSGLPSDEEIYLGLRTVAKDRPVEFKDSIANKRNEILSDILKGIQYVIIGKDAKGFFYESDKALIFGTTTKTDSTAKDEFVTFLTSKEGDIHYRQLKIKIRQKEVELEAPFGEKEVEKEE